MTAGGARELDETHEDERVSELTVVEALERVISWRERDLLPDTRGLAADSRARLVFDHFFDMVGAGRAARIYDAVLVDIDHAPDWLLREDHGDLHTVEGSERVAATIADGGAFALWSDEPPRPEMLRSRRTLRARRRPCGCVIQPAYGQRVRCHAPARQR